MGNVGRVYHYSGGEISDEIRSIITSIRINPQVEAIPSGTFQGCRNLTDVQFHEGALQVIGDGAFRDCTALQQVSIPPSVTELGDGAFSRCSNLTNVHFAHEGALKVIGEYAFYNCKALQQVSIPPSVKKLGRAFYGCSNLADVQFAHEGELQVIGDNAFRDCTALQQVSIPPSVTKLAQYAFYGCSNLNDLQFAPEGALKVVEEYAFHNFTSLQQVSIPQSVTKLGSWAFYGCSNLIEVILSGEVFLDLDNLSGELALNKTKINDLFGPGLCTFRDSGLTTIKIQLSQCMARLSEKCRRSVEGKIPDMHRLELTQDGNIFASFPVIRRSPGDMDVQDTNHQTAASLHRLLKLICFHELKESSILTELAIWKSRIDEAATPVPPEERSEYRVSIPDPAKCLIMEYCGFTGFLKPSIEGD